MTERTIYLDPPPYDWRSRKINVRPSRWYAMVQLDRDGYADVVRRKGIDPELPSEFSDAADAIRSAAIDRIWYDGSTDSFSWSNGPGWVTLFVPFRQVESTIEALRLAELDHQYDMLREIAGQLALPVEGWLAPGERELVRGVDFDPPPHVFLRFLRRKAKQQGVRLNGRATAGSVWVRPTLAPVEKLLREELPERYTGWTDRWSGYVEPDNAPMRPWGGAGKPKTSVMGRPVSSSARWRRQTAMPVLAG